MIVWAILPSITFGVMTWMNMYCFYKALAELWLMYDDMALLDQICVKAPNLPCRPYITLTQAMPISTKIYNQRARSGLTRVSPSHAHTRS